MQQHPVFPSTIPSSPGFDIQAVSSLAQSLPSHSWEYGTASQALLELYNSSLSVFGCDPFNVDVQPYGVRGLEYAQQVITISEDGKNALASGDGAVEKQRIGSSTLSSTKRLNTGMGRFRVALDGLTV
ncbi:hypothetical protein V5O48_013592, partial [Marasmius crinis-equi]